MCQLHMCSLWVWLGFYHWLINLQQHEWFESSLGPLGLECDGKNREVPCSWSICLPGPGSIWGGQALNFGKMVSLLRLGHRMS